MNLFLTAAMIDGQSVFLKSSLIILYLILAALSLSCLVFTFIMIRSHLDGTASKVLLVALYLVTCFVLISAILCTDQYKKLQSPPDISSVQTNAPPTTEPILDNTTAPLSTETTTDSASSFSASYVDSTDPKNWEIKWSIMQNSTVLNSYTPPAEIKFDDGDAYTAMEGIITFRGNNYRNSSGCGTANIVSQTITEKWRSEAGSSNQLSDSAWSGQPLVVRWDEETKSIMNLYPGKKAKSDLVEVIYATLDGHIYFYDLEDGISTRDPIDTGANLRGTGSLDPRGYPLLYVGSGEATTKSPRMFIISLIEGKVIYEQSGSDIDAYRRQFAFDSTPLIDPESDTLIWPCQSGLMYFVKLNTSYEKEVGTISVEPQNLVKLRYKTNLSRKAGTTASSIVVDHYLYYADNGGMFLCVDMRTMELVWAQDTHDNVRATPVFCKGSNGEAYIYTGTSAEYEDGVSYIHKLNARTGEILWEYKIEKVTHSTSVPGGILSSPILGKPGTNLEGTIIYCVSRTPSASRGMLIALDTETGQLVWERVLDNYAWSSPTAVYTDDGIGYFVLCDSQGTVTLCEGITGNVINSIEVDNGIGVSPVVFENTVVVGCCDGFIYSFSLE